MLTIIPFMNRFFRMSRTGTSMRSANSLTVRPSGSVMSDISREGSVTFWKTSTSSRERRFFLNFLRFWSVARNRPTALSPTGWAGAWAPELFLSTLPFFFSFLISRTMAPGASGLAAATGSAVTVATTSFTAASPSSTLASTSASAAFSPRAFRWISSTISLEALRIKGFSSSGAATGAGSGATSTGASISGSNSGNNSSIASGSGILPSSRSALRTFMSLDRAVSNGETSTFLGFGLATGLRLARALARSAFFSCSWARLERSFRWDCTLPTKRGSIGWLAEKSITPIFFNSLRIVALSMRNCSAS